MGYPWLKTACQSYCIKYRYSSCTVPVLVCNMELRYTSKVIVCIANYKGDKEINQWMNENSDARHTREQLRSLPAGIMAGMRIQKDVDIMGVQRGAHKDGEELCPKYVFKIPGGKNPDGSTLWGWNDAGAAYCARCGARDLDHIVLRDFTTESIEKDRMKEQKERAMPAPPPRAPAVDLTAANPSAAHSGLPTAEEKGAAARLGMFELEPGVVDPLAMNAYRDAARREQERQGSVAEQVTAKAVSAITSAMPPPATGGSDEGGVDETERFKAEVEKMVKEQLAKEKLSMLNAPVAGAPSSVKEMLMSLGLEQYLSKFEEEAMEMSVLVSLARSEGKEALDEALKEVGVKSVGHRLKIFAALQG